MADGARRLDEYLNELRARLGALPDTQVAEIAAELRSHVFDSAKGELTDGAVTAALERLGSAAELASLYETETLLARAGRSGSPWLLVRSLCRWATVSAAGGFALLGLVAGYVVAASFFCAALVKPFAPDRAGLWRAGDAISLHLGLVASPPPQGEELLGWWIVPLGLFLGGAALWLTLRFARWAIRRFPRAPVAPR